MQQLGLGSNELSDTDGSKQMPQSLPGILPGAPGLVSMPTPAGRTGGGAPGMPAAIPPSQTAAEPATTAPPSTSLSTPPVTTGPSSNTSSAVPALSSSSVGAVGLPPSGVAVGGG